MDYEYRNVVIRLGSDLEGRIKKKVEDMAMDGWQHFGSYALPDAGGIVLQMRRLRYRPGRLS